MDLNIGRGYSDGMSRPTLNMGRDIPKEWRRDSKFVQNLKQLLLSKGTCEAHGNRFSAHADDTNCLGEPSVACLTCFRSLCDDCKHIDNPNMRILTCDKCGVTMCEEFCEDFAECEECSTFCSVCKEDDDVDAALQCGDCSESESQCLSCGPPVCEHCLGFHAPKIIARNERLAGDIETLKNEINQLRQEIEELRN